MTRLLPLLAVLAACHSDAAPADDTPVNLPERHPADAGVDADVPDAAPPADCPAGSTLVQKIACAGTATITGVNLGGAPGTTVPLAGFDEPSAPCLPANVCSPDDAPTLLFSDSPESPASDGVLYADTVAAGRYRLYVYHANGGTDARKFPVVVLNQGAATATITITQRGLGTPAGNYLNVGKTVATDWLTARAPTTVPVPAGRRVLLDPALDALHATNGQLVHAIYDVATDAPLKLSVVSVLAAADAVATTAGLSLLPRDADHQRGTFPKADIILRGTPPAGASRLRLGADEVDAYLAGRDATTGDKQRLKGNYGLLYRISFDGGAGGLTARGGAWEGAASFGGGAPVPLPVDGTLHNTTDALVLGPNLADVRLLTGGSASLPIDLFVVR